MTHMYLRNLAIASILVLASYSHAELPADLKFQFQYETCDVTTNEPIYKSGNGPACGIARSTPYSDSSCPVDEYESCATPDNGVNYWRDITASPGSYTRQWLNGYGSAEACQNEGRGWISAINNGSLHDIETPDAGTRYELRSAPWQGEDTRDLIFGNRVSARNRCTFNYGIAEAVYNVRPNAACGIATRTLCRTRTEYNSCRSSSFGIESYRIERRRDASCGIRTDYPNFNLGTANRLLGSNQQRLANVDKNTTLLCTEERDAARRIYCLQINRLAVDHLDDPLKGELQTTLLQASAQALKNGVTAGNGRQIFEQIRDLYQTERSIARNATEASIRFAALMAELPRALPDADYLKLAGAIAKQALQRTSAPGSARAGNEQDPLWSFLGLQDLSQRRIPFRDLADLKILLLSTDLTTVNNLKGSALVVSEFYVRAAASHVNQRARDILQLQALTTGLQSSAPDLRRSISDATAKVQAMSLPPAIESAVLAQLRQANDSVRLQTVLNDLMASAKAEIATTLADTERFIAEISQRDRLFAVNMSHIHLIRGDYNHAVLALREAGVTFRQLTATDRSTLGSEMSFTIFRNNLKQQIHASLTKATAVFQVLSARPNIDLAALSLPDDQLNLSYALLDTLDRVHLAMGASLDGVRLQLLGYLSSNVIEPLRIADQQEL